jgi:F0F1-type ATP synthase gamma subunit
MADRAANDNFFDCVNQTSISINRKYEDGITREVRDLAIP